MCGGSPKCLSSATKWFGRLPDSPAPSTSGEVVRAPLAENDSESLTPSSGLRVTPAYTEKAGPAASQGCFWASPGTCLSQQPLCLTWKGVTPLSQSPSCLRLWAY